MGDFVPEYPFAKGPILYALDQISVHANARALLGGLSAALSSIASTGFANLEGVIDQHLYAPIALDQARTPEALGFLKSHWFDLASADIYIPEEQPVAPVLAMGMIKAIEESLKGAPDPIPIDAWWIMDHRTLEMLTLVSKQQITFLFMTPRPSGEVPSGVWGPNAEGFVTSRHGIVTRKYPKRS